ncbi:MAG: hypothetical protein VB085_08245 [Peptococcaceae bacterium]|nr:hypothetical protein [Peptococcaceae bacterium]
MITIFNRKELLVTYDLDLLSTVKWKLKTAKIEYYIRVGGLTAATLFASRRSYAGSFGQNMQYSNEYHIYVKKKDYEDALFYIHE